MSKNVRLDLGLAIHFGVLSTTAGTSTNEFIEAAGHHLEIGLREIIREELRRFHEISEEERVYKEFRRNSLGGPR
jgi:hypothetical protein